MSKIKKSVWSLLNSLKLGGITQLYLEGALQEKGWFRSFHSKQSVDKDGNPIPWCTYPFIDFIAPRLRSDMAMFEFGCGNSTIWYGKKVKSIQAVEHDEAWVELVKPKLPINASVVFQALSEDGEYAREVYRNNKKYDLIIVDGRDRNHCAMHAADCLTGQGVIVLDNAERVEYEPAKQFLRQRGFKQIDFWGMCPIVAIQSSTAIFYRRLNCLDI